MDQSNGYFTISDLAKELDVKKSHIRFCEENGLIRHRVSKLKRRVYNRYDCERLKFIFHFVLLGYSKEQIIDLIGAPDENVDENDQLMQGIEYALNELKNLEKLKEELSFTNQTRTINEIEMLREYIKNIKIIKPGVLEEPSAEPGTMVKERIADRPLTAIAVSTEKKITQHPAKVMSLFAAGLALVILIGGYFYYKTGQKEPAHSDKTRVVEAPVPMDQIAKTQAEPQKTQRWTQSSSGAQQDSLKKEITKSLSDPAQTDEKVSVEDNNGTLIPEKEKSGNVELEETPKDNLQKEAAEESLSEKAVQPQDNVPLEPEGLKEKAMPDVAGEETLMTAKPELGKEKVVEAKTKPILTESEKRIKQIRSEENINQQQNELSRLKSFLDEYCKAYSNKNLDKFITFFTSDATENNKPFHETLPSYRKNMETMESLTYRIELTSFSKQTANENIMVRGKFYTRYQVQKEGWEENNGDIFMELIKNGDSFLVKQLTY